MRFSVLLFCSAVVLCLGCSQTKTTASSSESSDPAIEQVPTAETLTIAAKKGRTYGVIRLSAESRSPILAKLPVGTQMKSFGRFEDWYQVQIPETGQLGWINDVYLEK